MLFFFFLSRKSIMWPAYGYDIVAVFGLARKNKFARHFKSSSSEIINQASWAQQHSLYTVAARMKLIHRSRARRIWPNTYLP